MLEKQTTLGKYGGSWIIRIPPELIEDSQFPFDISDIKEGTTEMTEPKTTILVNIKIDKKRLIIE